MATFYAQFGHEEVEFVTDTRYGNGKTSWLEFGPVPEEWKKIHDFLVESRRGIDSDDLDQMEYVITPTGPGQWRFEIFFNSGGSKTGTLTMLPDGSLQLRYPKGSCSLTMLQDGSLQFHNRSKGQRRLM